MRVGYIHQDQSVQFHLVKKKKVPKLENEQVSTTCWTSDNARWLNTRREKREDDTTYASPLHTSAGGGCGYAMNPPPAGVWRNHAEGTLSLTTRQCIMSHNQRQSICASHLDIPNPRSRIHTTIPIRTRPSLAASFRAAFLVPPLPRPKTSPSTSTRTAQIGVVVVPSATQSSYTHSTSRLAF